LDSLPDVIVTEESGGLRGFYERDEEGDWVNFIPFESYPNILDPKSVRRVDLSGDGHADMLRLTPASDGELIWHPSQGLRGFGIEHRTVGAPSLPLSDKSSSIQLCDMTGDGLSDIVHIRNGAISYCPNMGYGTFGARIVMGNSPWMATEDIFSTQCIRMADVTGSGTSDLIYVQARGGAIVYYNESGNSWSDGSIIPSFPPLDRVSAVDVLDLFGQGTPCLCWTSDLHSTVESGGLGTVHFVDLMGRQRPGLLTTWSNGVGCETTFSYESSFSYYRRGEQQGRPWSTKLPFPMQCVAKVVTVDTISQTSHTTRYSYHNGYYDHSEKQFRGFQLVESWDGEEFGILTKPFQRPPVLERSWFYTGLKRLDMASELPQSYTFDVDGHSGIPSAIVPASDDGQVMLEAYRALAGRERRSEIFSDDSSDTRAALPYLVTQKSYHVVMPSAAAGHMVTRVNDREELKAYYERVTQVDGEGLSHDDAKIEHRLVIDTDKYGNVLLEALVQYGKSSSRMFKVEDQARQQETVVTYTATEYTNEIENRDCYFQVPLDCQVAKFRYFVPTSADDTKMRYTWSDFDQRVTEPFRSATELPLEVVQSEKFNVERQRGCRVLINRNCTIYSSGDLTEPLNIGILEQYSIVHQTFSFALTNSLLNNGLSGVELGLGPGTLASELRRGGYVERPTDSGEWWIPSSRKVFGDGTSQSQLGLARSQFYVTDGDIDAYGNLSSTELDTFSILTKSSTNAVGSKETFENDYARLKPVLVTDENLNQTHTVFDPLSRPVGMARMGKRGDSIANSLDGFEAELDQVALEAFEQDPVGHAAGILGRASTRTIYVLSRSEQDPGSPSTMPGPGYTAELTCLNHLRADIEVPDRISVRFQYHNGQCHVVQETVLSSQSSDQGKATWNFGGWVVYDNKAQPVQTFHPFEASSHHFLGHPQSQSLLATTLLRDPLDRVVGLLNADHTWSKTRFTPWNQMTFHAGQTATIEDPAQDEDLGQYFKRLDKSLYYPTWYNKRIAVDTSSEERHAASQTEIYSGACINVHVDAAGHAIVSETGNANDLRRTRTFYNVWGQMSTMHDSLDRVVDTVIYHGQGTAIYKNNMDSGQRWVLPDIQGLPLVTWSDIGVRKRMTYDALRRLTGVMLLTKRDTASEKQIVKNVYGEHAERTSDSNLSGELYQCYDQSGLRTNMSFDIQGGCTASSFRHAVEYRELVDWSDQSTPPALENKEYRIETSYNALGMVIESVDADLGHIQREYDISGRLQSLQSFDKSDREIVTSSVKIIEYEAGDQVSRIVYGNGSQTTYSYDPEMRQLIGTRSIRARDNAALQDISYTRDALGKVVQTTDKAGVDPTRKYAASPTQQYWYDCHGQLIKATGRIQADPDSKQIKAYSSSSDMSRPGGQLIRYTESYAYDLAGNLQTVQHIVQGGYSGWTRSYSYEEPSCILPSQTSNRLSRTQVGSEIEEYRYDKEAGRVGCMTSVPGYSSLIWDYEERLASFSTQRVTDDTIPEMTWYVYNAAGDRVRKITERGSDASCTPTRQKETRYLPMGNIFTRYRGDGVTESRTSATLEMGDPVLGRAPVCTIEVNSDVTIPLASYQLNEKLVLDTDAKVISYQEFSPFGAKTYEATNTAAPRVYRFCSYRWDVESGLYFCEARYYSCWLGRWLSADPLGTIDGLDLYVYVGNDPVNFDDPGGTCGKAKDNKTKSPVSMNQEQFPTLSASPFAQSTSQTKSVPTETTGADKSTNAWNTPIKKIAPKPGIVTEVKKVATLPEETVPVYRTTFKARAEAFSDMKDLSSVITWYKGDFNHVPKTASYWSLTKEGALKHQYGEEEHVLLTMNVPKSVLQSGSVKDYGNLPTDAWRDRVNADRLGFTKWVSSEVTSARSKEVTIGPESMRSPGDFNNLRYQGGFKDPYDMYPSATKIGFNNWKYEPQVAFSGKQLQKLTQYSSSYRSLAPSEIRVSKK
jgi:RHS repeat-associated protein